MLPTVSIVVPCFNEEGYIRDLLNAIYAQTYPLDLIEVTIADGHSTDQTRQVIAAFQREHPDLYLQVIDNDARITPAAINRAVAASRGEIILCLSGHSRPYPDYVERAVAALESGKGENVGGVLDIRPGAETWIARSIAAAASHPLGVGDALYRYATVAAAVDTVPFGAWRRSLMERIGGFDETLLSNEDYEFNARIRESGGQVWLDPSIRSIYFARSSIRALAKQYWRYGFWKYRMLRRYPHTLRWRQVLPPLFVCSLVFGSLLLLAWPVYRWLLGFELAIYFSILGIAGLHSAIHRRKVYLILGLPISIAVMHISWGCGFLWSILSGALKHKRPPRK